jgi:hypothetical protein
LVTPKAVVHPDVWAHLYRKELETPRTALSSW